MGKGFSAAHGEDIKVVSGGFHVDHPLFWSDFNGYTLRYLPRGAEVDVLHSYSG